MRSRLDKLAKGIIEYEKPEITLSMDHMAETLLPGKKLSMDILGQTTNGVPVHVYFYSQNPRVHVVQSQASGRSIRFTVEVSTMGLQEGERITGKIDAVYNGGEFSVPYDFTIGLVRSSLMNSNFSSVEEFSAFAASDFEEAVRIFDWKDFASIPFMQDLQLHGLYRTYYSNREEDAGLREFLYAAGCPVPVKEAETVSEELVVPEKKHRSDFDRMNFYRPMEILSLYLSYDRFLKDDKNRSRNFSEDFRSFCEKFPKDPLVNLLYVWYLIQDGQPEKARQILIAFQDPIQQQRVESKDVYCLFLYLTAVVQKDENHMNNVARLVHRYFTDGTTSMLRCFLEYKLNSEYENDKEKAYRFLQQHYYKSSQSPLILQEAAYLFDLDDSMIRTLTEFELDTIIFGVQKGIFMERKMFSLLSHELMNQKLVGRYLKVLKICGKRFGNTEFLQALVRVFLQQKCAGTRYFPWYERAVNRGLTIQGLNEYYLLSRPKDRKDKLPESLVNYFSDSRRTDTVPVDALYENITTWYLDNEPVMDAYRDRLREYAMKHMKMEEYFPALIPMFPMIMEPSVPNADNAPYVLELFYLNKVVSSMKEAVRLVIHYPQLNKEAVYDLSEGQALVPVFSRNAILCVEDEKGFRHYDPYLSCVKVYENTELEKQCSMYSNDTYLTQLSEADQILEKGVLSERDLFLVTDLIKNKKTDAFYKSRLYEALIDLQGVPGMQHVDCCAFLLEADFQTFRPVYQTKLIECLISWKYYEAAYERILNSGFEHLSNDSLSVLLLAIMQHPIADNDDLVRAACRRLVDAGMGTTDMYHYLAVCFNGTAADMTALIRLLRRKKQPLRNLVERTLLVSLYTNQSRDMDFLFDLYCQEIKRDDQILQACLVLRSHEYFMNQRKLSDLMAEELKKSVHKLPRVASLALLTWYSECKEPLDDSDKALCESVLREASARNIVLACYGKLRSQVRLPEELEGRVFVEFRSNEALNAAVSGMVLPESRSFRRTLTQVYPGVFVRAFLLYSGEWMKYYFSIQKRDGKMAELEGEHMVSAPAGPINRGSRYDDILRLEKISKRGDRRDTAEFMKSLILKEEMINDIFKELEE